MGERGTHTGERGILNWCLSMFRHSDIAVRLDRSVWLIRRFVLFLVIYKQTADICLRIRISSNTMTNNGALNILIGTCLCSCCL